MTATLSQAYPPSDGWSTDDLDGLPEDGHRRELIDGVLIISPTPTDKHQLLAARLTVAMDEICPAEFEVTQAVEVRVNTKRTFIPDLLVITADAAARNPSLVLSHEVALVVEIVSPGSVTLDRITKPALYAKAGIPFFWRIETEYGVVVHTYHLDPEAEVYVAAGTHTATLDVDQPWSISIPIARLTSRILPRSG